MPVTVLVDRDAKKEVGSLSDYRREFRATVVELVVLTEEEA